MSQEIDIMPGLPLERHVFKVSRLVICSLWWTSDPYPTFSKTSNSTHNLLNYSDDVWMKYRLGLLLT